MIGGGPRQGPTSSPTSHQQHACRAVNGAVRENQGNGNCLYNSIFTSATDDPRILALFNATHSIRPIYDAVVNLRLLSTTIARHAAGADPVTRPLTPHEFRRADGYTALPGANLGAGVTLDTLELQSYTYDAAHFLSDTLMPAKYWGRDTVALWLAHELDTPS